MSKTLIASRHFLHPLWLEGLFDSKNKQIVWEDELCDVIVLNVVFLTETGSKKFLDKNQAILVDRPVEEVQKEYFGMCELGCVCLKQSKLVEWENAVNEVSQN